MSSSDTKKRYFGTSGAGTDGVGVGAILNGNSLTDLYARTFYAKISDDR